MIVSTTVCPHKEDLITADDPPHEALDDPHALDALARISDEARVAPREADEL